MIKYRIIVIAIQCEICPLIMCFCMSLSKSMYLVDKSWESKKKLKNIAFYECKSDKNLEFKVIALKNINKKTKKERTKKKKFSLN